VALVPVPVVFLAVKKYPGLHVKGVYASVQVVTPVPQDVHVGLTEGIAAGTKK